MYSHTHISSFQCGCVIDTVTCHSSLVPKFPQAFYNQIFVFRKYLKKKSFISEKLKSQYRNTLTQKETIFGDCMAIKRGNFEIATMKRLGSDIIRKQDQSMGNRKSDPVPRSLNIWLSIYPPLHLSHTHSFFFPTFPYLSSFYNFTIICMTHILTSYLGKSVSSETHITVVTCKIGRLSL